MATRTLRMMSPNGDTVLAKWDTETITEKQLKEIEKEFKAKMKAGYFAFDITDKRDVQIAEFEPESDILLVPKMQGGYC